MFSKKKYVEIINAKGIFNNTYETKIPQTIISSVILKHFEKSTKKPKCIFIGWDGCRCDSMKYLIKSDNKKVSGTNDTAVFSAISEVKKQRRVVYFLCWRRRKFPAGNKHGTRLGVCTLR